MISSLITKKLIKHIMTIRVGVRYLYLYLGTVFRVPVPVPVPDPHEQEVLVAKYLKKSGTIQVHLCDYKH